MMALYLWADNMNDNGIYNVGHSTKLAHCETPVRLLHNECTTYDAYICMQDESFVANAAKSSWIRYEQSRPA